MSRLSKWYAELKRLQDYHESECAGIWVFEGVPNHLPAQFCKPDCTTCVLNKDTFDNWFEDTFK